jgi:hypothetical protein
VKPVVLEFSAELFRGNRREKDLESISLDVIDEAHPTRKLFFHGFVVLGVLDCGQALLKSADVSRIVGEGVIGETNSAGVILAEESCDRLLRKAKISEAFAIGLADELVCPLHRALALLETLNFIDELFGCIGVIGKNGTVGLGNWLLKLLEKLACEDKCCGCLSFGGGRAAAEVLGFIVMLLRLGEMLIDAGEVFAMALLRMVPDQNWLTERDHFESFSGGEMSPGCNVFVLRGELPKARSFRCAF